MGALSTACAQSLATGDQPAHYRNNVMLYRVSLCGIAESDAAGFAAPSARASRLSPEPPLSFAAAFNGSSRPAASLVRRLFAGRQIEWIDRAAIGLSALCVAHCLTTAIVVIALASFGGVFLNPLIHEVGLAIAILLGAVALGTGVLRHGYMMPFATGTFGLGMMTGALTLPHGDTEMLATLAGVVMLAIGHDLNFRARH